MAQVAGRHRVGHVHHARQRPRHHLGDQEIGDDAHGQHDQQHADVGAVHDPGLDRVGAGGDAALLLEARVDLLGERARGLRPGGRVRRVAQGVDLGGVEARPGRELRQPIQLGRPQGRLRLVQRLQRRGVAGKAIQEDAELRQAERARRRQGEDRHAEDQGELGAN
ncbi:MAG: hypothetical protein OEV81_09830 [Betaproteobacteria bacterium]|nr:hypothetical protein [Betaproteobacteria bacterium]